MKLNEWYLNNTYDHKQFQVKELLKLKKKKGLKISLCFPTLNEGKTIGKILDIVNKEIYKPGLVDEVVIVDSDSMDRTVDIAREKGFKVFDHSRIFPGLGSHRGKGEALWKSLFVLEGDIIIWCDSDIKNFHPRFIYGLLGPLLLRDDIDFVKGFYQRPLKMNGSYMKGEGGRVTEIMVRPMLNYHYPQLGKIFQPLSGEYAGRREVFENIPFFTGYGVESGMLIDIFERFGLDSIAQVNIRRRVHRNQPLSALSRMSFGILQAITKKLEFYGKIKVTSRPNKTYNQIDYINKEYIMAPMLLEEVERPQLIEVREYRSSRKKSPQLEDKQLKAS
jgi:glycosyltransferase involved in cell wall biosynthesis